MQVFEIGNDFQVHKKVYFIRNPTISADCFRHSLKTYLFARL